MSEFPKLIMRGAESIITQIDSETITKHRPTKGYRVSELDHKFTTHRTRSEAKLLAKLADDGVCVPKLISVDEKTNTLTLEFLDGPQVKTILTKDNATSLGTQIGELVAQVHNAEVVHADLTTSNLILFAEKIYVLDFGLSYISHKKEDRAVDLHLLRQSLDSYHAPIAKSVMDAVIQSYVKHADKADATLEKFEIVEKRGRNKH